MNSIVENFKRETQKLRDTTIQSISIQLEELFVLAQKEEPTICVLEYFTRIRIFNNNGTEFKFSSSKEEVFKNINQLNSLICENTLISNKTIGRFPN